MIRGPACRCASATSGAQRWWGSERHSAQELWALRQGLDRARGTRSSMQAASIYTLLGRLGAVQQSRGGLTPLKRFRCKPVAPNLALEPSFLSTCEPDVEPHMPSCLLSAMHQALAHSRYR